MANTSPKWTFPKEFRSAGKTNLYLTCLDLYLPSFVKRSLLPLHLPASFPHFSSCTLTTYYYRLIPRQSQSSWEENLRQCSKREDCANNQVTLLNPSHCSFGKLSQPCVAPDTTKKIATVTLPLCIIWGYYITAKFMEGYLKSRLPL
jgi:hypothetical protein